MEEPRELTERVGETLNQAGLLGRRSIFIAERLDLDGTTLDEAVKILQKLNTKYKKKYSQIVIDDHEEYFCGDTPYLCTYLIGTRMETQEEANKRAEEDEARAQTRRQYDLQQLKALQERYPDLKPL